MSVFLIDYENVRTSAFSGLEDLTEEDRVIVFYTSNSDNLTFSLMQRLTSAKAKIEYLRVACGGKNSLDFQLCSYLGFLIGTHSDTRFCIVSRDKGFSTMLSLWGENTAHGNSVVCRANIFGAMGEKETEAAVVTDDTAAVRLADEESAPEAAETVAETVAPAPADETPAEPEPQAEAPEEEKPKPKRQYKRRTYNRKPKTAPADQSA